MSLTTNTRSERYDLQIARTFFETALPRREFLARSGQGFGSLALAYMLDQERLKAAPPVGTDKRIDVLARTDHFPSQAKAVIQLVQSGGPPQMDLFDHKPELKRRHGQT